MSVSGDLIIGGDTPTMLDLYNSVIEPYAAKWERLGTLLGLEYHKIENISKNNAYNPDRAVNCCCTMLKEWLDNAPSPTWGKLEDAVKKLSYMSSFAIIPGM